MSEPFDPAGVRVLVPVEVVGPRRRFHFNFALDTGATRTVIRPGYLERLGYDLSMASHPAHFRSATGGGQARVVPITRIASLGVTRTNYPVVAHDLPPAVTVDGLLGLDFFRGLVLTLDFARGLIDLDPPRRGWRFWR